MTTDVKNAKSWPFEEARRILNRVQHVAPKKGYVLLETGYGPSGLPHIGTFGEVARTSLVLNAFRTISDIPARLFTFSDDMDGLRKVPDNVPNPEKLQEFLGKPLTNVPDPFGKFESFAHHNNAMLRAFLDSFNFEYEFLSSTDCYKSGLFDDALRLVLAHYDEIMGVILPTLGDERKATYSPFLPICSKTGVVLQVPVVSRDLDAGTIIYKDDAGYVEVPVTGGHCKLQWKADWGMRWRAFDVDYEMSGKDLIDSVKLSSQICRIIGGRAPENLTYELFLDEAGQKISKSKGNGLTIQEWLRYAPTESLSYYMYQAPRKAKRLYFDVIPRAVDDYLTHLEKFTPSQCDSPVWHIHGGKPPESEKTGLSFTILLNLASVCNTEDPNVLWGFVTRYQPDASPEKTPFLNKLISHALLYYRDYIKPHKIYRAPTEQERAALLDLRSELLAHGDHMPSAEGLQSILYDVGKRHGYAELRHWFGAMYEVLLGQSEGPRMGSFIALYGVAETVALIDEKI